MYIRKAFEIYKSLIRTIHEACPFPVYFDSYNHKNSHNGNKNYDYSKCYTDYHTSTAKHKKTLLYLNMIIIYKTSSDWSR